MIKIPAIGKVDGEECSWLKSGLTVVVVGASGDLAKKKTYPSLLSLYDWNLLPQDTIIWGYARSHLTDSGLRDRLRPYLLKSGDHSPDVVERFLKRCRYQSGQDYGDVDAFKDMVSKVEEHEQKNPDSQHNRLFYFAIPPNVFAQTASAINKAAMQKPDKGWNRIIVEKPFGRDLESYEELSAELKEHFTEDHIYRIDHYLGKEMVENLVVLRFANTWFERVWNRDNVQCVMLTFKEPFGTEGRGGYFDKFGIIRDVIQNHLMQVMSLLAMEPPTTVDGPDAGRHIRDAKASVLNAIPPVELDDVVLGQYGGYADDKSIENKNTNTPTFAALRLWVNTPRWQGVPFILKAGKALDERKVEIRVQFRDPPAAAFMFSGQDAPRNELVMRVQPAEAIYIKTNVKSPGFAAKPIQSELEVNYDTRFKYMDTANPDAYTRLILDVLEGKHAAFVRDDELKRSWEIFTPLLHKIDDMNIRPITYKQGSRGPKESDEFIREKIGYIRNEDYVFYDGSVARKSDSTTKEEKEGETKSKSEAEESDLCDVGLYGLAVMGQNFALNMASKGFKVCVGNRSNSKVDTTVKRAKEEGDLPVFGAYDPEEFVNMLRTPRRIFLLVQAGSPVDETIAKLSLYMDGGDVIVDGGNEWYPNSIRRAQSLEPMGIHFIGMGISGGEEGARYGPSLMPGGPKEAFDLIEPIITKTAAKSSSGACTGYLGPIGSGNYVKMVHNGIEYGDMQLIAEVYDVLKNVVGMTNEEMSAQFDEWNEGELSSYLIEITSKVLSKKDDATGEGYVVDYILDKTGMKGTGRWTIQEAAERSIAAPTMAAALDSRFLSGRKEEREEASKVLQAPEISSIEKEKVIDDLKAALYASKICSYAQGMSLIKAASDEFGWNINLSECARLWTGGCIIRAKLLEKIQDAYEWNENLPNLMVDTGFAKELNERAPAWRRTVALCVTNGIACPSLCNSLTYFDTYRRSRLPANLTQAQRDFFGGHTYERIDAEGRHHCAWTEGHKSIGDANARTAGES